MPEPQKGASWRWTQIWPCLYVWYWSRGQNAMSPALQQQQIVDLKCQTSGKRGGGSGRSHSITPIIAGLRPHIVVSCVFTTP